MDNCNKIYDVLQAFFHQLTKMELAVKQHFF